MEQLTLEICKNKLQEAFDSNNKDVMVAALRYVTSFLPYSVMYDGVTETRVIFYSNGKIPYDIDFEQLDFVCAKWNVQGYINAIDKVFAKNNFYSSKYQIARDVLFLGDRTFERSDVLYSSGNGELSVDGLLKVSGYAVKLAQFVNPDY